MQCEFVLPRAGRCGRINGHSGRHLSEKVWENHHRAADEWHRRNPESGRAARRRHYYANKRYYRDRALRRSYKLTADEFDAMLAKQDGLCACCGVEPATTVDHDHDTGRIRGLLCQRCNHMIGHAKDDPARLRAGAAYLEAA